MDTKRMIDALNKIAMNSGVDRRADKPGTHREKKKTQPGAKHNVNPVFKPIQIIAMPPSMYRRMHKGVVTITPNYLKPHPQPKWRNRYEPQLDR